jgi:hypothetical protein
MESREADVCLGVKRSWCLHVPPEKLKFTWESREAGVYLCLREAEVYLGVKRSWCLPGSLVFTCASREAEVYGESIEAEVCLGVKGS